MGTTTTTTIPQQPQHLTFTLFYLIGLFLLYAAQPCTADDPVALETLDGLYDETDKRAGGRAFQFAPDGMDKRAGGRAFQQFASDAMEKRAGGRAFQQFASDSSLEKRAGGRAFQFSPDASMEKRAGGRAFQFAPDAMDKRAGGRSFRFLGPAMEKRGGGRGFRGFYGGGPSSGMNGYYGSLYGGNYPMLYEKKALSTDYMPYYLQQYKRGGARRFSDASAGLGPQQYWYADSEAAAGNLDLEVEEDAEQKEKRAGARNFPIFREESTEKRMSQ